MAWATFIAWLRLQWSSSIWLRPVCIGALLALVVSLAHQEYLDFAVAANETNGIFLSFVVKWGAVVLTVAVVMAVILHKRTNRRKTNVQSNTGDPVIERPTQIKDVNYRRPRSAAERILNEPPP